MEQKFISWLEQHQSNPPDVILGIGDDGAILKGDARHRVLVADAIIDKVHFDLTQHDLGAIGHKALAVNLSDIAAMGAVPEAAIVTLALPRSLSFDDVTKMFSGLAETAKTHGVAIVGGDTTRHDGPLMLSVSVTGYLEPEFRCPEGWRMDGAKAGDLLAVTGSLGGSIAGKHLSFTPRMEFARSVQERAVVNSATDISDSLAVDLSHVLRKSNVGAVLNLDELPISDAAIELSSSSGKTPLEHALYDGEDFELLISIDPSQFNILKQDPDFDLELHVIGRVVADHPEKIVSSDSWKAIEVRGYEH